MAQHGHLTSEEKKKIRQERRKLRKELRLSGIKTRREFEEIAQMLGLVYGGDPPLIILWFWFWDWLKARTLGWWLSLLGALMVATFLYAAITNQKGNFSIIIDNTSATLGLTAYDNSNYENGAYRLKSDVLKEVNPYSIEDLPSDTDAGEGSHNIDDVVMYTFWIGNEGSAAIDSEWYIVMNESTRNLDQAVWIMLFDEGMQTVYSRPSADGEAEKLEGLTNLPFTDVSADPYYEYEVLDEENKIYSVVSVPYLENNIVASGTLDDLKPGEYHRYTIAIWVDGDDPDCSDALFGGHAGYSMKFVSKGDTDGIYARYGYDGENAAALTANKSDAYNGIRNFKDFIAWLKDFWKRLIATIKGKQVT